MQNDNEQEQPAIKMALFTIHHAFPDQTVSCKILTAPKRTKKYR